MSSTVKGKGSLPLRSVGGVLIFLAVASEPVGGPLMPAGFTIPLPFFRCRFAVPVSRCRFRTPLPLPLPYALARRRR